MNEQSRKFLDGAADDYYERNKADFGKHDPVLPLIAKTALKPEWVLEVGCADGWRLRRLQEKYNCKVFGVDPSLAAIQAAHAQRRSLDCFQVGTAEKLNLPDRTFDLVIVGFCMWLIEPHQWMQVAAETDRVLKFGGALVIYDYASPYPVRWEGWANQSGSEREKDTTAFMYDFPRLWLGHPCYAQVSRELSGRVIGNMFMLEAATLLRKSFDGFVRIGPNVEAEAA